MEKPSGHGLAPVLVAIVGRTHGRRIIHETLLKRNQDLGDIARGGPLPRDQRDRASQRTAPACPDQGSSSTAPPTQEVPPCAWPSPISSAAGRAPSQVNPKAHSVTLSWKASPPRSSSKQDAIQGYNVYRSLKSNHYDNTSKINTKLLPGTQCVDTAVEPRRTYFYVVKAVAGSGRESGPSNQATAPIPFP